MLFDAQNRIEKIMKVQEEEDKENKATDNEKEDVVDLEYTAEDVEKIGVTTMGDTQDHDKAQKILVWLGGIVANRLTRGAMPTVPEATP